MKDKETILQTLEWKGKSYVSLEDYQNLLNESIEKISDRDREHREELDNREKELKDIFEKEKEKSDNKIVQLQKLLAEKGEVIVALESENSEIRAYIEGCENHDKRTRAKNDSLTEQLARSNRALVKLVLGK